MTVPATVTRINDCTGYYTRAINHTGYYTRAINHTGYCTTEVATVMEAVVTASVATVMKNNADSSGGDLADLIKNSPSWKYGIWYRPTMNFSVRQGSPQIVTFSRFDRSKDALIHGFWWFWT